MNLKIGRIALSTLVLLATFGPVYAQSGELNSLLLDFKAKATTGAPRDVAEADAALDSLPKSSKESVTAVLPAVLEAASDPHVSVRRLAAMALWEISRRSDSQALLFGELSTLTALLVDNDTPVRRVSMLAVATLRPDANSQIMPFLRNFLAREDAVSTIGPFVATVLLEDAPNDADSIKAVVHFMHRSDQTSESRETLLNGVRYRLRSQNRDVAKEVAAYANCPDEQISGLAIETLQGMGRSNIVDNQQTLSRIAADARRPLNVRRAAAQTLSSVQ